MLREHEYSVFDDTSQFDREPHYQLRHFGLELAVTFEPSATEITEGYISGSQ